jgi:hypothetical protein
MKEDPIHEAMCIYPLNVTTETAAYNNIEARVYNMLCDVIILQKRFVKKST